jgi:hypothetical protein
MSMIESLLHDQPKDTNPADITAPEPTDGPEDPCCTPPGGDPGPDR